MANQFSFVGTLGRDCEVKYTQSGTAILSFSAANNIGYGDKKQTLWIRVSLFGKRAEGNLKDYLLKGQQVFISGELSQHEYKGRDGTDKTSLELVASEIELVGSKRTEGSKPSGDGDGGYPYDDGIPF